jgi:hypothetical protein
VVKRRTLLLSGGALVVAGAAVRWSRSSQPPPELAPLLARLDVLRAQTLTSTGIWSAFRIFSHLAQSVDYSISGYPEPKPAWFRASLGTAAFFAFETAGAMRHGLAEPIPGAAPIAEDGDPAIAISGLVESLQRFEAHEGPLQPHFAYGALSKSQYRNAHRMHVENHLSEIRG